MVVRLWRAAFPFFLPQDNYCNFPNCSVTDMMKYFWKWHRQNIIQMTIRHHSTTYRYPIIQSSHFTALRYNVLTDKSGHTAGHNAVGTETLTPRVYRVITFKSERSASSNPREDAEFTEMTAWTCLRCGPGSAFHPWDTNQSKDPQWKWREMHLWWLETAWRLWWLWWSYDSCNGFVA